MSFSHAHVSMDQLVMQVGNPQNIEQTVNDDLIDAFMSNNALFGIEIGKLVINLFPSQFGVGF